MQSDALPNFGRYRVLAEIGRGAMGVVYKARDPKIDRIVAIKTIALSEHASTQEKGFRERFFLEAKAAGRLSHPSIVTIYDVGEDTESQNPFIVMEFVEGESLDQRLSQTGGEYDAYSGLALVQNLAAALDYAHSQGIVHRDIKPANILLTPDERPKITDFGVAKLNMAYQTVAGQSLGTPAYMSPEQLNGDPVDGRSDLFSLGVILYTLLTGHRPFQGNSAMTVSFRVVHREPLPVSAYDSDFPPDVDYVIGRAIAKHPAHRYQTGKEMAEDLEDLREGRSPRSKAKRGGSTGVRSASTQSPLTTRSTPLRPNKRSQTSAEIRGQLFHRLSAWEYFAVLLLALGVLIIGITTLRPPVATDLNLPPVRVPSASPSTQRPAPENLAVATENISAQSLMRSNKTTHNHATFIAKAESAAAPVAGTNTIARNSAVPYLPAADSSGASRVSAVPQKSSTLHIRIEHRFPSAQVMVWIDDKLAYKQSSDGTVKRKMGLFKAVQGYKSDSLALFPGEHNIRVRVQSSDDAYDRTATITGTIPSDSERVLRVDCTKRQQIHLTVE